MDLYDDETVPNFNSGGGDANPQMWYNQTVWSTCIYTPVSVILGKTRIQLLHCIKCMNWHDTVLVLILRYCISINIAVLIKKRLKVAMMSRWHSLDRNPGNLAYRSCSYMATHATPYWRGGGLQVPHLEIRTELRCLFWSLIIWMTCTNCNFFFQGGIFHIKLGVLLLLLNRPDFKFFFL